MQWGVQGRVHVEDWHHYVAINLDTYLVTLLVHCIRETVDVEIWNNRCGIAK